MLWKNTQKSWSHKVFSLKHFYYRVWTSQKSSKYVSSSFHCCIDTADETIHFSALCWEERAIFLCYTLQAGWSILLISTNSNFYYVIGILKLTVNTLLSIFNRDMLIRDMAKPIETGMCGLVPGSRWYLVRKSSLHLCVALLSFNVRAGGLAQSIAKGVEGSDGGTDKGAYAFLETKDTLTSGND